MWSLDLGFIKGCMFGIEYYEDEDNDLFFVVLDVGCIRVMYIKYNGDEVSE